LFIIGDSERRRRRRKRKRKRKRRRRKRRKRRRRRRMRFLASLTPECAIEMFLSKGQDCLDTQRR
jgi:hypothetical protein